MKLTINKNVLSRAKTDLTPKLAMECWRAVAPKYDQD